jgi:hypothetical protein
LIPPWPQLSCRLRAGKGEGGEEDLATLVILSMAKWARFCILNRQEMPGSSEQDRKLRGLSMHSAVSPALARPRSCRGIHSGACRRHISLKFSKAGAEVPGPCTECCRTKPRNFVAIIALVGRSSAVLTSGPTPGRHGGGTWCWGVWLQPRPHTDGANADIDMNAIGLAAKQQEVVQATSDLQKNKRAVASEGPRHRNWLLEPQASRQGNTPKQQWRVFLQPTAKQATREWLPPAAPSSCYHPPPPDCRTRMHCLPVSWRGLRALVTSMGRGAGLATFGITSNFRNSRHT